MWRPAHAVLGVGAGAARLAAGTQGSRPASSRTRWPDPARLAARATSRRFGLAELLDVIVLVGRGRSRASPSRAIFLRALGELGVEPVDAMFVGDRLVTDVQGAAAVGMTTVQALWFSSRRHPGDRAGLHGVHARWTC